MKLSSLLKVFWHLSQLKSFLSLWHLWRKNFFLFLNTLSHFSHVRSPFNLKHLRQKFFFPFFTIRRKESASILKNFHWKIILELKESLNFSCIKKNDHFIYSQALIMLNCLLCRIANAFKEKKMFWIINIKIFKELIMINHFDIKCQIHMYTHVPHLRPKFSQQVNLGRLKNIVIIKKKNIFWNKMFLCSIYLQMKSIILIFIFFY